MKKKLFAVVCILPFCAPAAPSFAGEAAKNYKNLCVSCHGKDGKGNPAMTKMFRVSLNDLDLTDKRTLSKSAERLARKISYGDDPMPAYKGKLTTGEIGALVAYIKASAWEQTSTKAADNADFTAKCVSCHGKGGKGNPAMARMFLVEPAALDLTGPGVRKKTDEDLARLILDGKGKMPAYKGELNDTQVTELLKFLKKLK